MVSCINLQILSQPDDTTCGPTCLHSVYKFYGKDVPLKKLIKEVPTLQHGGTLGVLLGCHALRQGFKVHIYTYNLRVFDPTWFVGKKVDILSKLREQKKVKTDSRLTVESEAYEEFIEEGGNVIFKDLTSALLRHYLRRQVPILTGLSATYLYHCAREYGSPSISDDVKGYPAGHFVVLCGYEKENRRVLVADPLLPNPVSTTNRYYVDIDRLIGAMLLGVITYDANLVVIEKK